MIKIALTDVKTDVKKITPAKLTAILADFALNNKKDSNDWQIFYLANNNNPIIGIKPKAYFLLNYNNKFILTQYVDNNKTTYNISFDDYKNLITNYYNDNKKDVDSFDGLMGFIGYDVSANQLDSTISIKKTMPCAFFAHYECYISLEQGQYFIYAKNQEQLEDIYKKIMAIILNAENSFDKFFNKNINLKQIWTKDNYNGAFLKTQDYLYAGDAYQINLTQNWQGQSSYYLYHFLDNFEEFNAPFAGYLLTNDCEIVSVSPELFFEFNHTHHNNGQVITTKPIKGTRPRHSDSTKDNALKYELATSEKDLAENVMIVDLLRNDLGKFAKTGTVITPKRFEIETFSNVHHMVSTVTAVLKDDISPITALFDSLPAGSVTGAPKKRACQIINELENAPRGAYCGSMGVIDFNGNGAFNVLIRTLQSYPKNNKTRMIELWAGGGITVLSDCDDEYQESCDKITHILATLAQQ